MNREKNNYQKQYRKHRVHRIIIFSQEEYQMLIGIAEQQRKPFGTLVREFSLAQAANRYILPLNEQTEEVRILLIRFGTNLNQIAFQANAKADISQESIEKVQTEFSKMQAGIMKIYNAPIQVKDLVRKTLITTPEYAKEIKAILTELQL